MADKLNLRVYSPERTLLAGKEVQALTLPGSEGQIEVYPEHARMVGTLETGAFSYTLADGNVESGMMSDGFFEIRGDDVFVMAEVLELSHEIDVERARRAQERAEKALESDLEPDQFDIEQLQLRKAVIRQRVASDSK